MKTLGLISLNLATLAMNFFSAQAQAQTDMSQTSKRAETADSASLKAMESTWLKVPPACKAAGFNAQPVALNNDAISLHASSVYQSYGA